MSFFIYEDDVIMSHHDLDQLIRSIDNELANLSIWFKVNELSLNVSKSNYMIFKNHHSNRIYDNTHILLMEMNSPKSHTQSFLLFLLMSHWPYVTNIVSKCISISFKAITPM